MLNKNHKIILQQILIKLFKDKGIFKFILINEHIIILKVVKELQKWLKLKLKMKKRIKWKSQIILKTFKEKLKKKNFCQEE